MPIPRLACRQRGKAKGVGGAGQGGEEMGVLEKGGDLFLQKGKGSLFFRSFVKPAVKSEGAVPKTTLPSDTVCKLGDHHVQ